MFKRENTVRYYKSDGTYRRIVEHEKIDTNTAESVDRRLEVEELQDGEWSEIDSLGEYVSPDEVPSE